MPFVPLPRIVEGAAELLELRRVERDERRREGLHARWLLASGQVTGRMELARQLGRNPETISRWLEDYGQNGRAGLLRAPLPAGRPHQGGIGLPAAAVREAIRARWAQPRGERGYLALWRWARAEHAVAYSYSHFHRWVHDQLGATLKEKLAAVQAAHPRRRVCWWAQDASRFGRQTIQRRRPTLPGVQPSAPLHRRLKTSGWVRPSNQPGPLLCLGRARHRR